MCVFFFSANVAKLIATLCVLKPGFANLCCMRCIQPRDTNFGTACVCRVPKDKVTDKIVECNHCGCRGCSD